jgi:hypothetical protein
VTLLLTKRICSPALLLLLAAPLCAETNVEFKKTQLDPKFRAEGVAVGDYNKDGKLDIAAGPVWYAAPDWKMHNIVADVKEYDPKGYSDCFNAWADDFNGDGWTDVLEIVWPGKEAVWFENPQGKDEPWKRHVATPIASNESPQFIDVDGDGKRELIIGYAKDNPDAGDRRIGIARRGEDPTALWTVTPVSKEGDGSAQRYAHGLGAGDVNGDGRIDIVGTSGWWEAPADKNAAEWAFHAAPLGQPCADMIVFDFDGDGDADILSSSAHAFGVWFHEQLPEGKWQTHELDKDVSQTHAICQGDINGDGLPDFVTGKRWWAHAAGDPGVNDPAIFSWYELKREDGKAKWTRHQFDHDSGHGTQFQLADMNGDGLLDVVAASKKGVHYFEQVRK